MQLDAYGLYLAGPPHAPAPELVDALAESAGLDGTAQAVVYLTSCLEGFTGRRPSTDLTMGLLEYLVRAGVELKPAWQDLLSVASERGQSVIAQLPEDQRERVLHTYLCNRGLPASRPLMKVVPFILEHAPSERVVTLLLDTVAHHRERFPKPPPDIEKLDALIAEVAQRDETVRSIAASHLKCTIVGRR